MISFKETKKVKNENFVKANIEIFTLCENDIIVTSIGIELPEIPFVEEEE